MAVRKKGLSLHHQTNKTNIMTTKLTKKELNETEVNLLIRLLANTNSEEDRGQTKEVLKKLISGTKFEPETYYTIINNIG